MQTVIETFPLRDFQLNALSALKNPGHVLCVAPTGSGKSLIYERFAAHSTRRTVLVTPLIALARQQREKLVASGIRASLAMGGAKELPTFGKSGVWIISPESLLFDSTRNVLNKWKPDFLVVDECHCLWDWGDQFRPAFLLLPDLIRDESVKRSLWLTATLPFDARKYLRMRISPLTEIGSFQVPLQIELHVTRVPWIHRIEALVRWIGLHDHEPGIVFVPTRDSTNKIARLLTSMGKKVVVYHAGLAREERSSAEKAISGRLPEIIVATSAFGMGMDHPYLKWVVLWQAPLSVLSLAQAIGRIGRNPAKARALVLWDEDDFRLLEWTVQGSIHRRKDLSDLFEFLRGPGCRKEGLCRYFEPERPHQTSCGACDICV